MTVPPAGLAVTQEPAGSGPVREAALAMLDQYVRHPGPVATWGFEDPGLPITAASLVRDRATRAEAEQAGVAISQWLERSVGGSASLGVSGRGLGGFVLGLRQAAGAWRELEGFAIRARGVLVDRAARKPWRPNHVDWSDYDLISGPAGTLLVLTVDPVATPTECDPAVRHLVDLCEGDGLPRLRLAWHRDDRLIGWNYGRVNCGTGHGVPGVAAALVGAADAGVLAQDGHDALARLARWLTELSYIDDRGVRTWPTGGPGATQQGQAPPHTAHASRRQAWCYGTPGIAWVMWEMGRVLADRSLLDLSLDAAASFVAAYDDDFYLEQRQPDRSAICHGAAGLLLTFDSFARHADLPGAAALAEHLERLLRTDLDRVVESARDDRSLLAGAGGVLATLLVRRSDGDRSWMRVFGLR